MDPRVQTSFIPKKPMMQDASARPAKSINLFALLATVVFLIATALSVGVFFYEKVTNSEIAKKQADLERAKGDFEPETIRQIVRLDTRINTSKALLKAHLAPSSLFDLVGKTTLPTVRFRDFRYEYIADDKIYVTMKGQAQSFAAVALQSDAFSKEKLFVEPIVSDLGVEPTGLVSFSVNARIDPSVIRYGDVYIANQQTE